MNNAPILILQMQRMGDLVLSFPLLGWLGRRFAGHPLWVVGEKIFFEPLMPLSPQVTYFSYDGTPNIRGVTFHAVLNLSHRPEAAALAGGARSDIVLGPHEDSEGRLRIGGDWQLYRASLTQNNHYNLYHWADLNALDLIPEALMLRTDWPLPKPLPRFAPGSPDRAKSGLRIGLFLGASEPEKHPDTAFWVALTRHLLRAGCKPVLLGGPAEAGLGRDVAGQLGAPALNLCGRFNVNALARFIAELDLMITPDTGPMHIAVWTGTPVLNLSLGPVNPWETGPFSPGHHVVQAGLECVGCWRCTRSRVECKERMAAGHIAAVLEALTDVSGEAASPHKESFLRAAGGLRLLRSVRGAHGLYRLDAVAESAGALAAAESSPAPVGASRLSPGAFSGKAQESRQALAFFWQAWFGALFGRFSQEECLRAWQSLVVRHPQEAQVVREGRAALALALARAHTEGAGRVLGNSAFWQEAPQPLRPLSGYLQMYLQNEAGSRSAFLHALSLIERLDLPV